MKPAGNGSLKVPQPRLGLSSALRLSRGPGPSWPQSRLVASAWTLPRSWLNCGSACTSRTALRTRGAPAATASCIVIRCMQAPALQEESEPCGIMPPGTSSVGGQTRPVSTQKEKPGLLLPQRPEDAGQAGRRSLSGFPAALDLAITAPQRPESFGPGQSVCPCRGFGLQACQGEPFGHGPGLPRARGAVPASCSGSHWCVGGLSCQHPAADCEGGCGSHTRRGIANACRDAPGAARVSA